MVSRTATQDQKEKAAAYMRQWRISNPDRWKKIAGAARKKWKAVHRDQHREWQREHRYKVRKEILVLIGGAVRCQKCGYDADWRALQIDHINGGGRADADTNVRGLTNLWSLRNKLKRPDFLVAARKKYQVLCANCNRIKCYTNDEQPRRKPKMIPGELLEWAAMRKHAGLK